MRILCLLTVFMMALNCKSTKATQQRDSNTYQVSECPENGTCSFHILRNKSFDIKKDEFDMTYGELNDSDKILLKFEYVRNTPENTADGQYRELIYIEIDPNTEVLDLRDKDLENANVIFGRICFCHGQTGYYHITDGHLKLKKTSENSFSLSFEFKSHEVPQVLTHVSQDFELENH